MQKEAMERPSAWARDEDLEEGKRIHDAKAVRAPCSGLPVNSLQAGVVAALLHGRMGVPREHVHVRLALL